MNPFLYADSLVKFQGSSEAVKIAASTKQKAEITMMDSENCGAFNPPALKKNLIFWQNVFGYLKKKFPQEAKNG